MSDYRADQSSGGRPSAEPLSNEQIHDQAQRPDPRVEATSPAGGVDEPSTRGYELPRTKEHGVEAALDELGAMEEQNTPRAEPGGGRDVG